MVNILLLEGANKLNISLNKEQIEKFLIYLNELKEWNKKFNLTTIVDNCEIIEKHFLDSLSCCLVADFKKPTKLLDIGTGAGFPGIPIKIYSPSIELVLLDSIRKKIVFLEHITSILNLNDVKIIHLRAENFENKNLYDVVVCRAIKLTYKMLGLCTSFLKTDGIFICQKGKFFKDNETEIKNQVKFLNAEIKEIKKIYLPFSNAERHLIVIKKN